MKQGARLKLCVSVIHLLKLHPWGYRAGRWGPWGWMTHGDGAHRNRVRTFINETFHSTLPFPHGRTQRWCHLGTRKPDLSRCWIYTVFTLPSLPLEMSTANCCLLVNHTVVSMLQQLKQPRSVVLVSLPCGENVKIGKIFIYHSNQVTNFVLFF